jgi:hypothetical protein
MKSKTPKPETTRSLLDAAMQGGLIDAKLPAAEMVRKLGPSIDEVAGYVLAWDKYVLVVAADLGSDVIITQKR